MKPRFSTPEAGDEVTQKKNEYDDAVRLYDRELASAIRTVMAKSKLPVLVFVTSDHGERVGDGGLFGHSIVSCNPTQNCVIVQEKAFTRSRQQQ